jgi:ribosomal-protein-alanine N-acetyltransferase
VALLRPWRRGDESALVRHANDRAVWRNLRDRFPHPYRKADARAWLATVAGQGEPALNLAIEHEGEAIGGAGLEPFGDVHRRTAEVGYWIGRAFWGRGIASVALGELTDYAFDTFDFVRLEASVFEWNPASARVLEKNGYVLEGRLRRSVLKDGVFGDALLYARLRSP